MTALPFLCGPKEGLSLDPLRDVGARGIRFTADQTYHQGDYLESLVSVGFQVVVTFDPDSFAGVDLSDDTAVSDRMTWYRDRWPARPLIVNVWNEWDSDGFESSPMPAFVVNNLARIAREVFGPNQKLAHGSIVSGQPARLQELDWTHVDYADVHEYTKVAPGFTGPPGGEALNLSQYRAVLPGHIGIIMSEIGLSSDQAGEQAQADYCESIMRHCIGLDDLALVSWFCGHPYNGWGLVRPDGSVKPAYSAYQRAVQHGDDGGGVPVAAKYPWPALEKYWRSIYPEIAFDIRPAPHGLGICRHWAEDPYKYGPPVSNEASDGNGNTVQLFAKRPIKWTPNGAEDMEP